MVLTPVRSSAIAAISYNPWSRELTVVFHSSDKVYTHHGVPPEVYEAFMAARSMGAYYATRIRGRYR